MLVSDDVIREVHLRARKIGEEEGYQDYRHWLWAKWQVRHGPKSCDLTEFAAEATYHAYQFYERSGRNNGHHLQDWHAGWLQSLKYHLPQGDEQRRLATVFFYETVESSRQAQSAEIQAMLACETKGMGVKKFDRPELLQRHMQEQPPTAKTVYFLWVDSQSARQSPDCFRVLLQHLSEANLLWHSDSAVIEEMTCDLPHMINWIALREPDAVATAVEMDFYCR